MQKWWNLGAVGAVFVGLSLIVVKNVPSNASAQLINVSYDATRELYQALNPLFVASYEKETGRHLVIVQSHGGSSRQARNIISGEQPVDVVTLGMFSDIDSLRKRGMIAPGWADRLPNHSLPYTSTIVFVVRRNNPRGIKDWPDLLAPGTEVVTPDPRTSGNGKLAALAAWAAVVTGGGTEPEACAYLRSLYQHVPVLDEGARGAAITFALQETGDVHLTMFDPDQRVETAEAMFLLGVMVGSIQILIAVFRLGDLTRYISESVIQGFMIAAALLLAVGQVSNALGVRDKGTGAQHILYRVWLTLSAGDPVNIKAITATVATLLLAILLRRFVRRHRLPQFDMLAVLAIVSAGTYLAGWTIPGLAGRTAIGIAGTVPSSLPHPHIPTVKLSWAWDLASDSVAIAFLGLLEALAIAKVIANQTRQKLDFNQQCLAEGVANLVGGVFQCLPGSGSLSRSAINFQAGAATRLSGILTASFVAIAVIFLAPLARYVPKPALAALLLLTASRLIDFKRVAYTLRASRMDAGVLVVTGFSAIVFGLDQAILIGVALSILLFVPRAAKLKTSELVVDDDEVVREKLSTDPPNAGFLIFDLEGELFFGAAPELERTFARIERQAHQEQVHHVLLRLKRVRQPDVVSLERLEHFLKHAEAAGITVWLAGLQPDLLEAFGRLRFSAWLAQERIFAQGADEDSATLAAIRQIRAALPRLKAEPSNKLFYLV